MALIEELEKSGNWLFRRRSFLPLILFVAAAPVVIWGGHVQPDYASWQWWLPCLLVSILGQIIRVITIGYTPRGTSGRNTSEGQVAETLNTQGIYGTVRHPLYLGNFFMWMGVLLFTGAWWFNLAVVLAFWLYYERIMFAEEAFLRKKFGDRYLQWSARTPAFIPRLDGWVSPAVSFSMRNVLKREYNGFFAVFVSFAMVDVAQHVRINGGWGDDALSAHWAWMLLASGLLFLTLRTLKKKTGVLDVEGREYV
jgi:protein-S-isoprenylcysteine O-methyltransferase Ste14